MRQGGSYHLRTAWFSTDCSTSLRNMSYVFFPCLFISTNSTIEEEDCQIDWPSLSISPPLSLCRCLSLFPFLSPYRSRFFFAHYMSHARWYSRPRFDRQSGFCSSSHSPSTFFRSFSRSPSTLFPPLPLSFLSLYMYTYIYIYIHTPALSLFFSQSPFTFLHVSLVMTGSSKIAYLWNLFCSTSFKSQNRPTWPHSVTQTRNKFQKHKFQTRTVDCERTDFSPPKNCVDVCPQCTHEGPGKLSGCVPCVHHTPPWYQPFWSCRNHSWSGDTVEDVGVHNVPTCVTHTRWKAVREFWDLLECTKSTHVQSHYGWLLIHLSRQQDDQPHFFLSIGTVNLSEHYCLGCRGCTNWTQH